MEASADEDGIRRYLQEIPLDELAVAVEVLSAQPYTETHAETHDRPGALMAIMTCEQLAITLPPRLLERAITTLASHPLPQVQECAAAALGCHLRRCRGLMRTEIIAEWATSEDPAQRAALARALRDPEIKALGIVPALELLAEDSSPYVRCAALEAVARRIESSPVRCAAMLRRHAQSDRRSVRLAAVQGLRRTVEIGADPSAVPVLISCAETTDVEVAEQAAEALAASAAANGEAFRWLENMVRHVDELDDRVATCILSMVRRFAAEHPERAGRILHALRRHPASWLRDEATAALAEIC